MSTAKTISPIAKKILHIHNQLVNFQTLGIQAQKTFQAQAIMALMNWANKHSPFWMERFKTMSSNSALSEEILERFKTVTPLTRAQLQSNFDRLSCASALEPNSCSIDKTTGSTGMPVRILRHSPSYSPRYSAYMLLGTTHWYKPDVSKPILKYSVREKDASYPNWGDPEAYFYPTGPLHINNCVTRDLRSMYQYLKESAPGYINSNSSIGFALAQYALSHDQDRPHIHAILTSSEAVTAEMRQACWDAFGAKVIDRYSCTEVGWIAFQCPKHDHLHVLNENVIVEIVDEHGNACDKGVPGRILVTALHSYAMPIIRYELGDIAVWGEDCDCGITLPVISKIWGKEREFIKTPDGQLRHVVLLGSEILAAGQITDIRIRYYHNPLVRVELSCQGDIGQIKEDFLRDKICSMLGFQCPVIFDYLAQIDWGDTDKRILFMDAKTHWNQ
ncbi:phenylacetate--CoA ligase family protein [Polynucleobacter asymbioticus]|jgi:phenylacetate-CoA ligase|uniref:Phenylacetate--CoA ligase family protein n=1 Tax=Polynucleobacter asymbioticus TaxID=576611 RepID=A0AAC9ITV9_9BURK|nr:phenylacetate--CoA ligase family protein [Polynucleobacter asymbioticus]APB98167.1 hypothetical protein A4F89_01860 [Polynucleobacter asymbioticus]APC00453.1 hypothetical protein AOC25_01865 [Polynucleobacter asymbioticus]